MRHEMNAARRAAFLEMRRQSHRDRDSAHCYWERDFMSRTMALNLERLGWLRRFPQRRAGRLTTIALTDVGVWILDGAP